MRMIINIKVHSNSSAQSIEQVDNVYIVRFKATREKGKANKKLIEMLSDYFHIPKSKISIVKGLTSTRKIVEICE